MLYIGPRVPRLQIWCLSGAISQTMDNTNWMFIGEWLSAALRAVIDSGRRDIFDQVIRGVLNQNQGISGSVILRQLFVCLSDACVAGGPSFCLRTDFADIKAVLN
jgi:hypothetical protein